MDATLVKESTAIVCKYIGSNLPDPSYKFSDPTVAFVDVGNCKTTLTIAKFFNQTQIKTDMGAEIIMCKSEQNLGGRDIDF